ncbi:MAG: hypothetical protein AAGB93_02370 [Planctomycetota bacterium]
MSDAPPPLPDAPEGRSGAPFAAFTALVALSPLAALFVVPRLPWPSGALSGALQSGPTWSCARPLFVDADGDGTRDLVGTVFRARAEGQRVAAFRGTDGRPLWISEATDAFEEEDESHLRVTLERGRLRATVGENEVWLDPADGTACAAPDGAADEQDRRAGAGWPFPDRAKIEQTGPYHVLGGARGSQRPLPPRDATQFEGFERSQELFPAKALLRASFGTLQDGRPALVGYEPGANRGPDREVWRTVPGGDGARTSAIPGFTAIDCDASHAVAAYFRGTSWRGGVGLSLIPLKTGEPSWDVAVPNATPFSGVTLRADRVYVATLDGLVVLDRATGGELFRVAERG